MSYATSRAFCRPLTAVELEALLHRRATQVNDLLIALDDERASRWKAEKAAVAWTAIDKLRSPEGNSVEILCDNPDGPQAIVCCADFTGYKHLYFHGANVLACLELASFTQDRFNEGGFRFVRTEGVDHEH